MSTHVYFSLFYTLHYYWQTTRSKDQQTTNVHSRFLRIAVTTHSNSTDIDYGGNEQPAAVEKPKK